MNDFSKFDPNACCPVPQPVLQVFGPRGHILPLRVIREMVIAKAFVACGASPTKTAESLKIGRSTLYRLMKELEPG